MGFSRQARPAWLLNFLQLASLLLTGQTSWFHKSVKKSPAPVTPDLRSFLLTAPLSVVETRTAEATIHPAFLTPHDFPAIPSVQNLNWKKEETRHSSTKCAHRLLGGPSGPAPQSRVQPVLGKRGISLGARGRPHKSQGHSSNGCEQSWKGQAK